MRNLTLKTHAVTRRDHEMFQAVLTLADSALTHRWHLTEHDSAEADIVLVSFDANQAPEVWETFAKRYSTERLIAYTGENAGLNAKWHLRRVPNSIPRLSEVVKVLNNVAHHFQKHAANQDLPARIPPVTPEITEIKVFHPRNHLTGAIQAARENGGCVVCTLAGFPPVFLAPRENAVYTQADENTLSALCRRDVDDFDLRRLSEDELRAEVAALGLKRWRTLAEFLWFSVLAGSNGRLLAGCTLEEPVYLREWPGYVRLSYYGLYQELATRMAGGAAGVKAIAATGDAPLPTVIDFHNACAFFGLIARGEEARRLAGEKLQARDDLRHLLKGCRDESGHLKVVFAGTVGAGKTTAVTLLSETPPILTETNPSDGVAAHKETTTVAMEYGEIHLESGFKLQIYGTPGQRRFDFMGKILVSKAWGLVILIDNRNPDPLAELDYYISLYADTLKRLKVAVGISHYAADQPLTLEDYRRHLQSQGLSYPAAIVDPRDIKALASLVSALGNAG